MTTRNITPATLGGRCATNYEKGRGSRVHAVPSCRALDQNEYCISAALCGATPGARSVGWTARPDLVVTCPKCKKAIMKGGA
ncbi:hypothetical protein EVC37_21960 [Methylocaldum sp. BRCS4]|nr:hypothetical protein [Methylocaldum sp. BRCS4]